MHTNLTSVISAPNLPEAPKGETKNSKAIGAKEIGFAELLGNFKNALRKVSEVEKEPVSGEVVREDGIIPESDDLDIELNVATDSLNQSHQELDGPVVAALNVTTRPINGDTESQSPLLKTDIKTGRSKAISGGDEGVEYTEAATVGKKSAQDLSNAGVTTQPSAAEPETVATLTDENKKLKVLSPLSQESSKQNKDLAQGKYELRKAQDVDVSRPNVAQIPSLTAAAAMAINSQPTTGTKASTSVLAEKARLSKVTESKTEGSSDLKHQGLDIRTQSFLNTMMDSKAILQKLDTHHIERNEANSQVQSGSTNSLLGNGIESQIAPLPMGVSAGSAQTMAFNPLLPQFGVATPISHPGWAQAMSQQLLSFVRKNENGLQEAQLRLDPPELGPLKVSISIKDGVASASFVSANPAVRAAVEQALPQLAQNMSDSGLTLGQTDVGDQSSGHAGDLAQGQGDSSRGSQSSLGRSEYKTGQNLELESSNSDKIENNRPAQGLVRAYA